MTAATLAVGIATTLVSLITGVQFFRLLTPGALAANLVLIPAAGVVTLGGFASVLCGLSGFTWGTALCNHAVARPAQCAVAGSFRAGALFFRLDRADGAGPPDWRPTRRLCGGLETPPRRVVAAIRHRGRCVAFRGEIRVTVQGCRNFSDFLVSTRGKTSSPRAMKSAYELAMERLAKSDPSASAPLTKEQKSRLAEIDRVYQGKLAEREIFLKKQLEDAFAAQKMDDAEKIKQQMASERARLDEDREAEKERLRRGFGSAKT
jgi:hypothetical protein